jgi:urea carboxylase
MEGPGGYQFVGRTVQMWNRHRTTADFRDGKQWLLRFFDQIRFYPVTAERLERMREDFPHGKFQLEVENATLRLRDYRRFLTDNAESITRFKARQQAAFEAEREHWTDLDSSSGDRAAGEASGAGLDAANELAAPDGAGLVGSAGAGDLPEGCIAVSSPVAGSVWQVGVSPGKRVNPGDELVVVEAMKMEIPITAEEPGHVVEVRCIRGRTVSAGETLIVLRRA